MKKETYNGWSNYATWRVALEIIDNDYFIDMIEGDESLKETANLEDNVTEYVEMAVFGENDTEGFMSSFANAFLNDVDYWEIAENILSDYALAKED